MVEKARPLKAAQAGRIGGGHTPRGLENAARYGQTYRDCRENWLGHGGFRATRREPGPWDELRLP
jgi:hypothetical protein